MKKNIAIVAHKYLPQMDDDLALYLNEKKYSVLHINHSFPDAFDRISSVIEYKKGKKLNEIKSMDYVFLAEFLVYIKEFIFTYICLSKEKKKFEVYIGMDGLCSLFGLILKYFGICKKVVYWCVDFVPIGRFGDNWKNAIYHRINIYVCKHADEVWDLSPRMLEGRKKYYDLDKSSYKIHKIVQNGMWLDRIKKIDYSKCDKNTIVFMGHLMKKQGVDTIIKQIPNIVRSIPNFTFKIIGDGNYRVELEKLVNKLSVQKYCNFMGRLNNVDLENEIAKSAVAIAPYLVTEESYTYYADPGKVKTYLACGIPVLMTNVPWNAKEIKKNKCGLIIDNDGSDLIDKLKLIMSPEINREYRGNAIKYAKKYDFKIIFNKLDL